MKSTVIDLTSEESNIRPNSIPSSMSNPPRPPLDARAPMPLLLNHNPYSALRSYSMTTFNTFGIILLDN